VRGRRIEKGRRWRRREMGTGTVMGDEHEAVKGREGSERKDREVKEKEKVTTQ
jgi:hypothetical protein